MWVEKENISSCDTQTNYKHFQGGYGGLQFGYVMDFFKECASLKKPIPKHFFTNFLNDLSIEDLVTLGNLLSIEFMKPRQRLYVILGKRAWVPQELRNNVKATS
jgi:hypothetical protein